MKISCKPQGSGSKHHHATRKLALQMHHTQEVHQLAICVSSFSAPISVKPPRPSFFKPFGSFIPLELLKFPRRRISLSRPVTCQPALSFRPVH
jgi:aromatic ring-opening dioxygenase LigB subunit